MKLSVVMPVYNEVQTIAEIIKHVQHVQIEKELIIVDDCSTDDIVARGFDRDIVERVVSMVRRNEYKRRQAAPGVRISGRAFGRDWRYPITNGFR